MHAREDDGRRGRMMENGKEWSEMVGKGEVDGLRTVEGLRGRLLAERLASRAAREEAEFMSKRLMELERLLIVEIKARKNAEKRLKCMLKSLDSLKIFGVFCQSNVSEGSGSSSACFSGIHRLEEEELNAFQNEESARCSVDGRMKQTQNLSTSVDGGDEASGTMSPGSVNQSASQEESWVSARTAHSYNSKDPGGEENMDFQYNPKFLCSVELEADDMSVKVHDVEEPDSAQQQIDDADDRLALVPAGIWAGSNSVVASEPQNRGDVQNVLVALKHVKMQLQNTMGRTVHQEFYGL